MNCATVKYNSNGQEQWTASYNNVGADNAQDIVLMIQEILHWRLGL